MDDGYYCDYCKCELTEETGHYKSLQNKHPYHIDLCSKCVFGEDNEE